MKALRFVSALLIVAAFAGSCIKDEMIGNAPAESHTVTISANFSDFTKTLISEDSEGHYKALWEAGDVICVTEIVTGTSSDPNLNDITSQSDFVETAPLAVGGETATFTVNFEKYWWEDKYTTEELATYTFNYQYFACTKIPNDYNSYYIATDYENGKKYIPLIISNEQKVYEGGYNTDCDMLVSQFANYDSRPDKISFSFARLGTIVKMTLKGLQQGDVLKSGYFYTGDNYMAACSIEEMVIYYPETGTYKNRVQLDYLSDGLPKEYCQINFTSSDESRPIVFDENGEAVLYFRILPGVCDDCFGVKCTVERGGVEMEYSKFANLETLGRSLTFKEGGLTKFSVELKPAVVASPTKLNYFVPKPRTGFTAYWQADPNAIGYECQYVRTRHYDYDTGIETTYPKVKLTPVKGSGDKEGMYYVEVPGGMEADSYVLGVRPIPNSDSGLCDFDLSERTLYVGVPAFVRLHNSSCEKITESIWKLTEMDDTSSSPWYLDLTNMEILGNDGSHWFKVKDTDKSWVISTCTEPEERQHIGEIHGLTLHMDNATIENTSEVYGLKTDGTSTKMSNFTRDGYLITYDFIGEGSFNGFRIKDSNVNKGYPNWSYIYIDCYPPEKMY